VIRSLTGFGRAVGTFGDEHFSIEVSSVNHRFLECSFRLPGSWSVLEPKLKEALKRRLARGKVNITLRRDRGPCGRPNVKCDLNVAEEYLNASRELVDLMSSTERLSLDTLSRMDGVFYQEEEEQDLDAVLEAVQGVMDEAVTQVERVREQEGAALAEDMKTRVSEMTDALAEIERQAPEVNAQYETRLRERVAELASDSKLTEERLAIEVALLCDKSDVNEEVVRLKAHFAHVTEYLGKSEPVGRELNFLAQEIQREVNTIGSKLRDLGVTREVLRMKSELEKLREQAQNIE